MIEERVQRRLAAILAADVVGYSRLMREDDEGTLTWHYQGRASWSLNHFPDRGGRHLKTSVRV